jgi:hypothetical protein
MHCKLKIFILFISYKCPHHLNEFCAHFTKGIKLTHDDGVTFVPTHVSSPSLRFGFQLNFLWVVGTAQKLWVIFNFDHRTKKMGA